MDPREEEAGYDMHGGSGNGSAGFVAGSNTGVLKSVAGGTRYQAVVSDNGGYSQVGFLEKCAQRIIVIRTPLAALTYSSTYPTPFTL